MVDCDPTMGLTAVEQQKVTEFLNWVNVMQEQVGLPSVSEMTAVKFLAARKFDVTRAVTLFRTHETLRDQYELRQIDPSSGSLKDELDSGKFSIMLNDSAEDPQALALYVARKHHIQTASHDAVMKCIIFQLDCALKNFGVQRQGLTLLYDMSGSSFAQFDYTLSRKLLQLLQDGYPARLKKIYILKAPLWFKGPLKIVSPFLKKKFLERLRLIENIQTHLPLSCIPETLGGSRRYDHVSWVQSCVASYEKDFICSGPPPPRPPPLTNTISNPHVRSEAPPALQRTASLPSTITDTTPPFKRKHSPQLDKRNRGMSTHEIIEGMIEPAIPQRIIENEVAIPRMPLEVHLITKDKVNTTPQQTGLNLFELQEHMTGRGQTELNAEYMRLRLEAPAGRFSTAKLQGNIKKNRYSDILAYDHTRVKLQQLPNDPHSDYINANYVDGYKQNRAFIFTQGALPHTFGDFWRMVWEQKCYCIVMTTKLIERGRTKCGSYWPDVNTQQQYGYFIVMCESVHEGVDFTTRTFRLTFPQTGESREIVQFQFLSWPDFGTPTTAEGVLTLLKEVRHYQASRLVLEGLSWTGAPHGPPIIVHCSAGVGRSGTFAAIDICLTCIKETGSVNVFNTVRTMRAQRAHSIQTADQYLFIYAAVLEVWQLDDNEQTSSISSSEGESSLLDELEEDGEILPPS